MSRHIKPISISKLSTRQKVAKIKDLIQSQIFEDEFPTFINESQIDIDLTDIFNDFTYNRDKDYSESPEMKLIQEFILYIESFVPSGVQNSCDYHVSNTILDSIVSILGIPPDANTFEKWLTGLELFTKYLIDTKQIDIYYEASKQFYEPVTQFGMWNVLSSLEKKSWEQKAQTINFNNHEILSQKYL